MPGSAEWRQCQPSGGVRFRLLGPLHASRDGVELPVRTGKLRVLLVTLLLEAGLPVPTDQLVATLWEGAPQPRERR
jgi:DNA-binding SARP family transcriptional activator